MGAWLSALVVSVAGASMFCVVPILPYAQTTTTTTTTTEGNQTENGDGKESSPAGDIISGAYSSPFTGLENPAATWLERPELAGRGNDWP